MRVVSSVAVSCAAGTHGASAVYGAPASVQVPALRSTTWTFQECKRPSTSSLT